MARDLLLGWKSLPVKKAERKIRLAAPLHLFWVIWKERNRVIFDDVNSLFIG